MRIQKLALTGAALILVVGMVSCQNQPTNSPPTAQTPSPDEYLDLVFISDSSGWGVADRYAAYMEQDLGVTVTVHDEAEGGLAAGFVLYKLDHPQSYELSALIAGADVIVFYANPVASVSESHPGDWNCVEQAVTMYVADCSPDTFDQYRADLDAIYGWFVELREGKPTIIRALDSYVPIYSVWRDRGIFADCLECWTNYTQVIHEAAADHHVLLASGFDEFNGPDHQEDPRDKGYIGGDGEHTLDSGRDVIAGLLRDLGYEYTIP